MVHLEDILVYLEANCVGVTRLGLAGRFGMGGPALDRRLKPVGGFVRVRSYYRVRLVEKAMARGIPFMRAYRQGGWKCRKDARRSFVRVHGCMPGYWKGRGGGRPSFRPEDWVAHAGVLNKTLGTAGWRVWFGYVQVREPLGFFGRYDLQGYPWKTAMDLSKKRTPKGPLSMKAGQIKRYG